MSKTQDVFTDLGHWTDGSDITHYECCAVAEGFSDQEHSEEDVLKAWAHLIRTGMAWQLQGWYGRTAASLIESGMISKDGKTIYWENC